MSAGAPHADKFRLAIAALAAVAVVAIAVAVAVAVHGSARGSSLAWSAWKPDAGGKLGASEIAQHVAPLYRSSETDQLDVVTLVNLTNSATSASSPGSGLELAVGTGSSLSLSDLSLLPGKTIAYDLCGVGGASNCALPDAASSDRLLLLRREALELALYTFKYISGTANVVAVLPPGYTMSTSGLSATPPRGAATDTKPETVAVLFVRDELAPWLRIPLADTLSALPPLLSELPAWHSTEEAALVDQITARSLYTEHIESVQTGGNLLVLSPLPPQ